MDISGKPIWQRAAGDTDRDYAGLCLEWDVILNGPGEMRAWPACATVLSSDCQIASNRDPRFASNRDPLKLGRSGLIHVVHRRAPRPTPRVSSRWRRWPWEVPVHPHGQGRREVLVSCGF